MYQVIIIYNQIKTRSSIVIFPRDTSEHDEVISKVLWSGENIEILKWNTKEVS